MFGTVSTAGINRFFQDGRDDTALVRVRTVHVRWVDPPIGEDSSMAVACF